MLNWLALAPMVILLAGALALLPARRFPRARGWISIAAMVAALLCLFLNAARAGAGPLVPLVSGGNSDLELAFSFGLLPTLFSAIVLVSFIARLQLQGSYEETHLRAGALIALAGAIAFLCSGNWPTIAASWLVVDLGLLLWRFPASPRENSRAGWWAFALSQAGLLAFIAAGAVLYSENSPFRLAEANVGGIAGSLAVLAAWARSGLYPFHFGLPAHGTNRRGSNLGEFALTSLLGLWLLAWVLVELQEDPAFAIILELLALIGVAATALLALTEADPERNVAWAARALGAPAVVAPLVAAPARAAFVLWLALGLFNFLILAFGASILRAQSPRQPWRQLLWLLAILCAAGFPLTPGFLGRTGYYAAALDSGDWLMFLLLVAATTCALVPPWRAFFQASATEELRARPAELLGIGLVVVPLVLEGVLAFRLAGLLDPSVEQASTFAYDALFRPASFLEPPLVLLAVLLPLPLSLLASRSLEASRARLGSLPQALAALIDLTALAGAVEDLLNSLAALLRRLSALIEEYPIGWVLFAAIWIALWLMARG